uniref:Golgi transport 1A n=1 Tax=Gallus gallus TaxID=9031 RepID=A0A8V1ABG2_CHICK
MICRMTWGLKGFPRVTAGKRPTRRAVGQNGDSERLPDPSSAGIGVGLVGFGIFFILFGMLLYFDSVLLAFGNILFLSGLVFIIGFRRTFTFFFQRQKMKGSSFFLGGVLIVLMRWPLLGMLLEAYGFITLFRSAWTHTAPSVPPASATAGLTEPFVSVQEFFPRGFRLFGLTGEYPHSEEGEQGAGQGGHLWMWSLGDRNCWHCWIKAASWACRRRSAWPPCSSWTIVLLIRNGSSCSSWRNWVTAAP